MEVGNPKGGVISLEEERNRSGGEGLEEHEEGDGMNRI